jgi:NAD+ synthase (glutamine-hydrolysing)
MLYFDFDRVYISTSIGRIRSMKITLAQLNPVVGDVGGNAQKAIEALRKSASSEPDLVVFPELFITGYPPKDLLQRPDFIAETAGALNKIAEGSKAYPSLGVLIGVPLPNKLKEGKGIYNAAVLLHNGKAVFKQAKSLLPTYDVFDEARYFDTSDRSDVFKFKGESLGITICEDAWNDPDSYSHRLYSVDPVETLARNGATLLINISASPFTVGKEQMRFKLLRNHARKHQLPFALVNQIGGNDDLVFDGRSLFLDTKGVVKRVLPSFEEAIVTIDTSKADKPVIYAFEDKVESVYKALVLGVRDYVRKCGFDRVVLGVSGGVDSAVTCVIAAEALGCENVLALAMPSPYSSEESLEDAQALAGNLGVKISVIPIAEAMQAFSSTLENHFAGLEADATEENIQARIRGNIIMAFSNKLGFLPLSTGNKSELAVGYCTLYGDMSGGLAVISDVPKTLVYELAHFINREREIIPQNTIAKPPSAELRPGQLDRDVLPPYDVLDGILERYVDEEKSYEEIVREGFDRSTAAWVIDAVRRNEYKRKQAPQGIKITSKAFGSGRRMPVAARYKV